MRTTVTLDDDVVAAVERLRRQRGLGLSEAINELARSGAQPVRKQVAFRQATRPMGMRIDVTNIGEVLDTLDQG